MLGMGLYRKRPMPSMARHYTATPQQNEQWFGATNAGPME